MILIDTNVLIYAIHEDSPQHQASLRVLEAAQSESLLACLFPQVLLEFFAVVTDPRRAEKPATSAEGLDLVTKLSTILPVLAPSPTSLNILISLINDSGTQGQRVFDAYLVAQMMDAGVNTVCTYNVKDFGAYPVTVRTPEEVLNGNDHDAPFLVHDRSRVPR